MFDQTVATGAAPHIVVEECSGSLAVRGTETRQVRIRMSGDAESSALTQEGDVLTFRAPGDCRLTCPPGTMLTLKAVRGDLQVRMVHGAITAGQVNGSADLRDVGSLALGQVSGDLRARGVAGDVVGQGVSGDARVRAVAGQLTLHQVGGDLRADAVQKGIAVEAVSGDVRLGPPFAPGAAYRLSAGGDLVVRLNGEASVHFKLQARGNVQVRVPNLALQEQEGALVGDLGTGEALLEASVGGRAVLKAGELESDEFPESYDLDLSVLDDLGPLVEARVAEAMADLNLRLENEGWFMADEGRLRQRVEQIAEQAAERARQAAEREAERARRAAEREAERARIQAEQAERRWQRASGHRPAAPPTPPAPPAPPASATDTITREERLRVLRLVEAGRLTPEEASDLIAALMS